MNGALGSLTAETIAEHALHCRLIRCGVTSMPDGRSGSQAYLHRLHGISGDELRRRVADALDTDHQSVVARSV